MTMHVQNLETGVLQALGAYKRERGMSAVAAAQWATAHLSEAMGRMEVVRTLPANRSDFMAGSIAAFQALKTWAQSIP